MDWQGTHTYHKWQQLSKYRLPDLQNSDRLLKQDLVYILENREAFPTIQIRGDTGSI